VLRCAPTVTPRCTQRGTELHLGVHFGPRRSPFRSAFRASLGVERSGNDGKCALWVNDWRVRAARSAVQPEDVAGRAQCSPRSGERPVQCSDRRWLARVQGGEPALHSYPFRHPRC
jgi:hypothetical protein